MKKGVTFRSKFMLHMCKHNMYTTFYNQHTHTYLQLTCKWLFRHLALNSSRYYSKYESARLDLNRGRASRQVQRIAPVSG